MTQDSAMSIDENALFKALKASSAFGSYLPDAAAADDGDDEIDGR